MMDKIRIVIADDQSIIREGLKVLLEMEDDLEVVGLAANGEEAYKIASSLNPDVVLMDIRMPICDGVTGTKRIYNTYPNIKIIVLTTFNDDEYIFEALKGGAKGYLLKDVQSDELVNSIRTVMRGGVLIHQDVATKLVKNLNMPPKEVDTAKSKYIDNLTSREIEIVKLIGKGKSNKEIASELFLSEGTVKNYITNILSKLYLRDRTQVALYAVENRLV